MKASSLDEYLSACTPVNFIKMDPQGAEALIIESMQRTLQTQKNVQLTVELRPYGLHLAGSSAIQLPAYFHVLGFKMHEINEQRGGLFATTLEELSRRYSIKNQSFTNLFFTHPE